MAPLLDRRALGGRLDKRAIGVSAAGIACFLTLYATQPMLPALSTEFGVPLPQTGLTVTAPLIAVAVVAPFVGAISDQFGRQRLILGASILLAIPTLLSAFAGSYALLLASRFLQGLAMPFIFAVVIAYISEEAPGPAALRLTGIYQMASIVGGFVSRVGNGIITDWLGWRAAFLVCGGGILLCAGLIALTLPRERNFVAVRGWRAGFANYGVLLRDKRLLATFALGFSVLFSIVSAYTFSSVRLALPPFQLSPGFLGSIFTVYLFGTLTTGLGVRGAVRFGRRRSVMLWVAVAIGGVLLTLPDNLTAIICGLALIAGGIFPVQAMSLNFVATNSRRAKSTALGIYTTCYYLGGAVGGVAPALIWRFAGWAGCVALFVALQLCVLTVALTCWADEKPA